MIRLLDDNDIDILMNYLRTDIVTNYLILLSLERSLYDEMYLKKWGEFNNNGDLIAVMLKRRTNNMQFFSRDNYDSYEFADILKNEEFNKLIGEETILSALKADYVFSKEVKGPFISRMDNIFNIQNKCDAKVKKVNVKDIDRIIELYERTLDGFATRKSMTDKYENVTGRGYYIDDGEKIVAVAQSSFENRKSAVITGVATHPDFRKKGYASKCVSKLCSELINEGKCLYLQYDNEPAGSIYKRLGFYNIGRMIFLYS